MAGIKWVGLRCFGGDLYAAKRGILSSKGEQESQWCTDFIQLIGSTGQQPDVFKEWERFLVLNFVDEKLEQLERIRERICFKFRNTFKILNLL